MNNETTIFSIVSRGRLLAAVIAATLACVLGAPRSLSAEHPMEHPQDAAKPVVPLEEVAKSVESYVKQQSKDGSFKFNDKPSGRELALTLDRVHRERLSAVGPDMYFVCADFKSSDGKRYDLDFFVQGKSKDSLRVLPDKISVHKEDGKERYTWAFNAEKGVWEQKPIGAKTTEHPTGEHP